MDAEAAAQIEELLLLAEGFALAANRSRTKSRASDDADVKRLIAIGGAAVAALAAKLDAGTLTHDDFVMQALALLNGHAQTAAGIGAAQFDGTADTAAVDDLIDGQAEYLDGFADDIDGGGMSAAEIAARAALYGGAIWTALQMGRGHGAEQAGIEQCTWELDEGAQSCDDCIANANGSPYDYPDGLPSYPGDGSTACLSNCRCAIGFEVDDSEKAAPVVLVKEARCPMPNCGRWVGRNIPVGSECYCPTHKAVVIEG